MMIKNSSVITHSSSLSLRAPAKINWFLTILGKRKDGYHDIMSFMQCIGLYDELLFSYADTIEIVSDLDIPREDNLVYKAALLLRNYASYGKGVRIVLHKQIPSDAGLGGGSSNAAYTLLGLNILWALHLQKRELNSIGLEIGSDVPFFLNGPSAVVKGKGEQVTPLEITSPLIFLLVKPPVSVSTAWAYTSYDTYRTDGLTKKLVDIKLFCEALLKRDFASLCTMLNNDLEGIVIEKYPVVREIKEGLLQRGAVFSAMSGSGPTVFGVFESEDKAFAVARKMGSYWCRVVTPVTSDEVNF